jgi:triosephosphate isomerase
MARRLLIAGNWKMNGLKADGLALAKGVAAKLAESPVDADVLVCPPATLVDGVAQAVAGSALLVGGQDCHADKSGAHTGDTSAVALKDLGAAYVIVGHSERRADHGETDAIVQAKAAAAHAAGLIAIICIGETEKERDQGLTIKVVGEQFLESVPKGATAANTVIAYEPVWAIGTGRTPSINDVAEVHGAIRGLAIDTLGQDIASGMRILYGGSMKPSNAKELLALDDVDGGLIGGASLKVEDFWGIAQSCP